METVINVKETIDEHSKTSDDESNFEEDLNDLLKDIANKEGIFLYNIERKKLSNTGGSYMGVLFEVNLRGTTIKGEKEINLFLKRIMKDDTVSILSLKDAYKYEMFVYKELSIIYADLQKEANIPDEEKFKPARCYGVVDKRNLETVALDNLLKKNYATHDRMKEVPLRYAEMIIKELAKYHGLGFVLQKKQPKYFQSVKKKLKKPFPLNESFINFIKNNSKNTLDIIKDERIKMKIEDFVENKLLKNFDSYFDPSEYSTLCHGDPRINNFMAKMQNGEHIKVKLVDYQFIYYGCPINDFFYFIYCSTDKTFRKNHMDYLKNLYYDYLSNFLLYFNLDIKDIYPKKVFTKDYKERFDFGLMCAIIILPYLLVDDDVAPDLEKMHIDDVKVKNSNEFEERMLGIIDDYLNLGYL